MIIDLGVERARKNAGIENKESRSVSRSIVMESRLNKEPTMQESQTRRPDLFALCNEWAQCLQCAERQICALISADSRFDRRTKLDVHSVMLMMEFARAAAWEHLPVGGL